MSWWERLSEALDNELPGSVNKALSLSFNATDLKLQLVFLLVAVFLPSSKGRLAAHLSALLDESELNVFRYVKGLSDLSFIRCPSLDDSSHPRQWSLSCEDAAASGIFIHDLLQDVALSQLEPGRLASGRRSFCFKGHSIISDSEAAAEWKTTESPRSVSIERADVVPFLPRLFRMTTLTSLVLTECHLSCPIPAGICGLTNLAYLDLHNNRCDFACTVPPELSALSNLTVLHLHRGKSLSGPIPPELSALTRLTELDLTRNSLSGVIPPQVSTLTNLTLLDLADNQLSGCIPPQLSALTNLRTLNLSYNQLSSIIPLQLSALTNLDTLNLANNQLSGSIPLQLSALTNLSTLNLADNQLSGSIPHQLFALTNLTELYLSENHLSGSISPQLSALTNLKYLYLHSNHLSGSLLPELSALTNLTKLYLHDNQLIGDIPPELSALMSAPPAPQRSARARADFRSSEPSPAEGSSSSSMDTPGPEDTIPPKDTTPSKDKPLPLDVLIEGDDATVSVGDNTPASEHTHRHADWDNVAVSGQEITSASEHKHVLIEGVSCLRCCDSATIDIVFVSGPRTE
eukprot:TRINITY_DN14929_c0_g5_i1.p1 TRINITY_DN14929_c0_g5~~TRINITY_DN14929_c0_g5_i1.p1  ORF type:complete len:588 (-),score=48.09 TRINITY_DN14929_c0_g5_i1:308-2032(-)